MSTFNMASGLGSLIMLPFDTRRLIWEQIAAMEAQENFDTSAFMRTSLAVHHELSQALNPGPDLFIVIKTSGVIFAQGGISDVMPVTGEVFGLAIRRKKPLNALIHRAKSIHIETEVYSPSCPDLVAGAHLTIRSLRQKMMAPRSPRLPPLPQKTINIKFRSAWMGLRWDDIAQSAYIEFSSHMISPALAILSAAWPLLSAPGFTVSHNLLLGRSYLQPFESSEEPEFLTRRITLETLILCEELLAYPDCTETEEVWNSVSGTVSRIAVIPLDTYDFMAEILCPDQLLAYGSVPSKEKHALA